MLVLIALSAAVHPRGCGERITCWHLAKNYGGSSPLVRGTVIFEYKNVRSYRFIPAGAGNGSRGGSNVCVASVHPRGCGERINWHGPDKRENGSYPRVRGTGNSITGGLGQLRFIPAGAGNGLTSNPR